MFWSRQPQEAPTPSLERTDEDDGLVFCLVFSWFVFDEARSSHGLIKRSEIHWMTIGWKTHPKRHDVAHMGEVIHCHLGARDIDQLPRRDHA